MQRNLISIVSRQTIPNILFINEAKDIDKYIFIYTDEMEKELACIVKAAHIASDQLCKIIVEPFSVMDVKQQLDRLNLSTEDEYEINITGGTKIMSLGVYQYFTKLNSNIYYLPIGENTIQEIYPDIGDENKMNYELNLEEYFNSYGIDLLQKARTKSYLCQDENYTRLFMLAYTSALKREEHQIIGKLRSREFDRKEKVLFSEIKGLEAYLKAIRFPVRENYLNRRQKAYLTGGWFEEYVYAFFKKNLGLTEEQIACGLEIKNGKLRNEFDVAFIYKNKLFVLECKTGLKNLKPFNQAIYKLSALDEQLGIHTASYIVSLSNYHNRDGTLLPAYSARAKKHDIKLLDRTMLLKQNGLEQVVENIKHAN